MTMNESVALVTGGSRGIGRAICLELARQGAAVAVNYAGNEQAAQETVEACRALGVQAEAFQADVSDPAACESLIARVTPALFTRMSRRPKRSFTRVMSSSQAAGSDTSA